MLESKITIIKEHLWPAGIAALAMHGLMIAAMALGVTYPEGTSPNDFRVDVMFMPESRQEKGVSSLLASVILPSHCEERSDVAIQGPKARSDALPLDRHALCACDDGNYLSNLNPVTQFKPSKKRGEQPAKASAKSTPSSAGQPSVEAYDVAHIFNPPPIYPYEAKQKRLQGVVLIQLFLTENGAVHKAVPLPPHIDPLLEDAALNAVYTWRFGPGDRILEVPIEFKLEA